MPIQTLALKPPKPPITPPGQRKRNLCDSCGRVILPTGECGGCTGS